MSCLVSRIRPHSGFTLLEMLVVLILVSLLSALIIQGFVYSAGVFRVVERKQNQSLAQELYKNWLSDSISGLINGMDVSEEKFFQFAGNEARFSGVSLTSISSEKKLIPVRISWVIEDTPGGGLVRYGEAPWSGGDFRWYDIALVGEGTRFTYLTGQQWVNQFPGASIPGERLKPVNKLPDAVALVSHGAVLPRTMVFPVLGDHAEYVHPERSAGY